MIKICITVLAMMSSFDLFAAGPDYSIKPSRFDLPALKGSAPSTDPLGELKARIIKKWPYLRQYSGSGIIDPWPHMKVILIADLQNAYLKDFLTALDHIGQGNNEEERRDRAFQYAYKTPADTAHAHNNAYEQTLFEIAFEISEPLTDLKYLNYIKLEGKTPFLITFAATGEFPWMGHSIKGLKALRTLINDYLQTTVPVLTREHDDVYGDPAIIDFFNEYNSLQLSRWIKKRLDQLFNHEDTSIGMKYRLMRLIKQSTTNDEALRTLYVVALLQQFEFTASIHGITKDAGIRFLEHLTQYTDWLMGRTTIFWSSKWKTEGKLQRHLPLVEIKKLYQKVMSLRSVRKSIERTFPTESEEFVDSWANKYLLNNDYTSKNIIQKIEQEKRKEEQDEEQDTEVATLFEHFVTQSYTFIKRIFSLT